MYLNICQRLSQPYRQIYFRQIYTSVSQNLMKNHTNPLLKTRLRSTGYYWAGLGVLVFGLSYSAVPLYKVFCQSSNYGGTINDDFDASKISTMSPIKEREIKIKFTSDTVGSLQWKFKPRQTYLVVVPGQTALAFFSVKNQTDDRIVGISTYNVLPYEVGKYFNKIQCFCFEEQMLYPHEEVDLPVFFFIDPEFAEDPKMEFVDEIILSYTFFEAKPGIKLPVPSFVKAHSTN